MCRSSASPDVGRGFGPLLICATAQSDRSRRGSCANRIPADYESALRNGGLQIRPTVYPQPRRAGRFARGPNASSDKTGAPAASSPDLSGTQNGSRRNPRDTALRSPRAISERAHGDHEIGFLGFVIDAHVEERLRPAGERLKARSFAASVVLTMSTTRPKPAMAIFPRHVRAGRSRRDARAMWVSVARGLMLAIGIKKERVVLDLEAFSAQGFRLCAAV
jgi:hypothetical protein